MNDVRYSRALRRYTQNVALYVPDPDLPRKVYDFRLHAWRMANWARLKGLEQNPAESLDAGWPDLKTFKFPETPTPPPPPVPDLRSVSFRGRSIPITTDLFVNLLAARVPADDEIRSVKVEIDGRAESMRSADIEGLLKDAVEELEGALE